MNNSPTTHILILPALILLTPFLVFLDYNSYCLTCAETWIAIGGFLAVALICSAVMLSGGMIVSALIMAVLITAFIDLQFAPRNWMDWIDEWTAVLFFSAMQTVVLALSLKDKFYTITTAVFVTFFSATVLQLALGSKAETALLQSRGSGSHAPPRIVHLILDEHIGIEGIPTDIEGGAAAKRMIAQFYSKNGFNLYGNAFSRYFETYLSVPTMFNFSAEADHARHQITGAGATLLRNRYFELLSDKGYRIEALSTGFLDLCSANTVATVTCRYDFGTLHIFAELDMPVSRKFQVVISRYLNQSTVVSFLIRNIASVPSLRSVTWAFELDRMRLNSLNALHNLSVLQKEVSLLPHGTAFVAHLILPHAPYVARADCSIRPAGRQFLWRDNNAFSAAADAPANTPASREERYKLYFEQLQCLYSRLDQLVERMRAAGIYDDSIILLHGDHGSRIFINEPFAKNRQLVTHQDLVDGFSTLFAMKLPGKPGGYEGSTWPLEQLFAKFAYEAGLTPVNLLSDRTEPYVYLTGRPDEEFTRVPYVPAR